MALDVITDWVERLAGRLYQQFRGRVKLEALVALIGAQAQEIEDAGQELLTLFSIDQSEGAQLDLIGRIVGQLRAALDDATYRLYLRARIRANRSSGTKRDIYAVFYAMFGAGVLQVIVDGYPAGFTLTIATPLTATEAAAAIAMLIDAKGAGIRAVFQWQQSADADMFYTDTSATLNVAGAINDVTLLVDFTGAFPAGGGSLKINPGLADEETVTYTGKTLTSFTGVSPLIANHLIRSQVSLVGGTGKGFGDSTNATVGGNLAGAV